MSSASLFARSIRAVLSGVYGLTILAGTAAAQTPASPVPGPDTSRTLLVGTVTRADLKEAPFSEWFDREYANYEPVDETVRSLAGGLDSISVEIYFGSWCGDSKREVPRVMRILDLAGFDERQLSLVALSDRPMEFMKAPGDPQVDLLEVVDGERTGEPGRPVRGQHVAGSRHVVADGRGRPEPGEHRARMAHQWHEGLGVRTHQLEVLGSDQVRDRDGLLG